MSSHTKQQRVTALRWGAAAGALALIGWVGVSPALAAEDPEPFRISGDAAGLLSPGISLPLNLQIFNPNDGKLKLLTLSARVDSVETVGQGVCTVEDFAVDNVLPLGLLAIPADGTRLLSDLGLPVLGQPRVRMLNTPVNQNGCKNATVHLVYEGTGLVDMPDDNGGNGGGGHHTPGNGHSGGGNGNGGETGNGHLPGTGATQAPSWLAITGLGLAALGALALRPTRRTKKESK